MSFIENDFSPAGAQARRGVVPQMHSYTTPDTLATVKASGYFDDIFTLLSPNDGIMLAENTGVSVGMHFIFVSAITAGVVTIQAEDINAI